MTSDVRHTSEVGRSTTELLVLILSVPDDAANLDPSLRERGSVPLRVSKDTIPYAVAMLDFLQSGRAAAESILLRGMTAFANNLRRIDEDLDPTQRHILATENLCRWLGLTRRDLANASSQTKVAMASLERDGLVIDPAFSPEAMVFLGLIPVHFSLRTPKGQRVYKELSVSAGYWSLNVNKGKRADGSTFTDFEFRLRGLAVVRQAICMMAQAYLRSEEKERSEKGLPVMTAPDPHID